MPRPPRTSPCDLADARARIAQASLFAQVADLVLGDESEAATSNVAVSLAVLAGIAASDAACCAQLGERPRGQAHAEAIAVLARVRPGGTAMAKDLDRLIRRKDDAQYGTTFVAQAEAARMVGWAHRLVAQAARTVESA